MLGLAIVLALGRGDPEQPAGDRPVLVPPPPEVDPGLIQQLLPKDSIRAIDDPQFEGDAQVAAGMNPDERVVGLVINGDARAYPINILSVHEVVNDVVGGEPVAITWCPLCYTALVFSRQVEGRAEPLSFGVSGALLHETLVMYDRQTDSLWSQLYGAAVDGPLDGARLAFFPSVHTEWSAWQKEHADGQVLSKSLTCAQFNCGSYANNPFGSYEVDPYESYYQRPDEGVVNRQLLRDGAERGPKKRVLGVRLAGRARAYPYDTLKEQTIVNDEINGVPILIWFDPATKTGAAFGRRLGTRTLTFDAYPADPDVLVDRESGSRWQAISGTAVSGPLEGESLLPLVATPAFEFGWSNYFPESETYTIE